MEDLTVNLSELSDEALKGKTKEELVALIEKLQSQRESLMKGPMKGAGKTPSKKAKKEKKEEVLL